MLEIIIISSVAVVVGVACLWLYYRRERQNAALQAAAAVLAVRQALLAERKAAVEKSKRPKPVLCQECRYAVWDQYIGCDGRWWHQRCFRTYRRRKRHFK